MIRNYNKSIILPILILLLIGNVFALDYMGSFKRETCVELKQTCSTCTYINITISDPDGGRAVNNQEMASYGAGTWGYNFCSTSKIGRYDVTGEGDIDNSDKTFAYYFDITPSGFIGTLGFYIILLAFVSLVIALGFWVGEEWFVVIGGMALIALGIYSINYGIADQRDMFMTWGVGLFEIGIGAILAIGAAFEKVDF